MAVGRAGGRRPTPAWGLRLGAGLFWGEHCWGIWHKRGDGRWQIPEELQAAVGLEAVLEPGISPGLSVCLSALTDAIPTTCCFSYQQQPVPLARIASVYVTSSRCTQPGVM